MDLGAAYPGTPAIGASGSPRVRLAHNEHGHVPPLDELFGDAVR